MTGSDDYFSEQDDVLTNKLGIADPQEMKRLEAEIVPLRMAELLTNPPKGRMDFRYLRNVHHRLFSDLYFMAGEVRGVDLAKGTSVFCYHENIEISQETIFLKLDAFFAKKPLRKRRNSRLSCLARFRA
jgi:cell filamentation protein